MFISNRFPSALHVWSKQQRIAVSADVRSPENCLMEEFLTQKETKSTFLITPNHKICSTHMGHVQMHKSCLLCLIILCENTQYIVILNIFLDF